jgi:hypothetical protein
MSNNPNSLAREIEALKDRVAKLEAKPHAGSPEAIKAAVLAEFDASTLRPLSAPKDLRTQNPDTFERVMNVAWANVAKRLAGEV